MADPVEISNVGGYRGVASEATLLALVDSIKRQGLGNANNQTITRLQNLHNRSISEGTKEVKAFDKAIGKTVDSLTDFTKELIVGGDRISDFADAILGSQNVLARFIGFVEGTFDQFRNLASVGANFNNSFLQMISTSTEASMTIDGFTELVRNNSSALASFGGTVTSGAQYFARFSRDFRTGVGMRFMDMGFTIADINEGLIGFLEIERMRSSRALRSDAELQAGAENYLMQLDRLAKVTGRQRRELEDVMQRQLQDAGIRAQLNRLDGQQRENFQDVLTFIQTELPGLSDGLIDLMDGVAQTDLGRALQSQLPGITGFMQEAFAGGATLEEFMDMLANRYGPRLDGLANSFSAAQLQQMRLSGGIQGAIAEMIDAGHEVNTATSRDARAARAEQQAQADLITKTFGRFEQAIIEVRKFLFNSLINSDFARAIGDLGDAIFELFEGRGSGTFQGAVDVMQNGMDFLFGSSGILTRAVTWLSGWIRRGGLQQALTNLTTWINEFVQRFSANMEAEGFWRAIGIEIERIINNLFGAADETGERTGGLISRLMDGFVGSEFWANFKTKFFEVFFNDANAQREGEDFLDTIKRLTIDRLTGTTDSGLDLTTAISNYLRDVFLGPLTETELPNGQTTQTRQGGLLDQLTQWLFNDENLNRGDFMTKVSEFAAEALATTVQAFTSLLETSQPLIDAISNGFGSILDIATARLETFIAERLTLPETNAAGQNGFWDRLYQKILDVISGSTGTLNFGTALEARLTSIIESMIELPETNTEGQNGFWDRLYQKILDVISGTTGTIDLGAAISQRITALVESMIELPETNAAGSNTLWDRISQRILDFISGNTGTIDLGAAISQRITALVESMIELPETNAEGSNNLWDRITQKILDFISGNPGTIDLTAAISQRLTALVESMIELPEANAAGSNTLWDRITQRILNAISGEQNTESLSSAIRTRILSLIGAEQTGLNLYEDILNFIGLSGEPGEGILTRIERALGIHSTQVEGETLWERITNKLDDKLFNPETGLIPTLIIGFETMMQNPSIVTSLTNAMTNLLGTISDSFVNYWEGSSGQRLMDSILNFFDDMWIRLLEYIDEATGLIDDETILNRRFEQFRRTINTQDGLSQDEAQRISDQIALMQQQKAEYEGIFWDSEEVAVIDAQIAQLQEILDTAPRLSQGTNGFQNFGRESLAILHGAEAVVPRNTPAGELLQAFYDMQSGAQRQTDQTATIQTSFNQSELATKIDQLNSIMTQVAGILTDQKDIQTRTMRSLKGMGTDLFKGAA